MLKLAITGKGGAGKTMIASTLAYLLEEIGERVYAVDADPNPTLGQALGFPQELISKIYPILTLKELIKERTGAASSDSYASYFKLNPSVLDIPEKYSAPYRNIRLLIMGQTRGINTGCACSENAITKALVSHLILQSDETVLLDMVAGTEHLGRGTASGVNCFIIIVEPSLRSIQAAETIETIISQIENIEYTIVGNKIRDFKDRRLIENHFGIEKIGGFISWNEKVIASENKRVPVYDEVPETVAEIRQILNHIYAIGDKVKPKVTNTLQTVSQKL